LNESQKNDYLSHLNNITCCTDSCLKKIDHQNAFRRYEGFTSLNKENQNSFLLGFMAGSQIANVKTISLERQWYLYENVREHVQNPNKRDIYCPHHLLPKPRKNQ